MRVIIDNLRQLHDKDIYWYKKGEEYYVEDYRWNSERYYEIAGWDGLPVADSNYGFKYWIIKTHCREIIDQIDIDWNLFGDI
jgi:hypothetical protein